MYDSSTLHNSTPIYNSTTMFNSSTKYKVQSTVLRQIARIGLDGARWAINRPSGNHRKLLDIVESHNFLSAWRTDAVQQGRPQPDVSFLLALVREMNRENRNPLDTWTLGHLDSQAPQSSCWMIKGQFSLEDTETETETETKTQANLDEIKFHPFVSTLIRARVIKSH